MKDKNQLSGIWHKECTVHSYEADQQGFARLSTICNYFQEAAWEHAEHLNFGYSDLARNNWYWVLSRFYLEVESYPRWNETVTVETWPRGVDRLFALRDYILRRQDGTECVRSTSAWLILDIEKKRPMKGEVFDNIIHLAREKQACDKRLGKLEKINTADFETSRQVRQSELDPNKHVNNVRYIEWIQDMHIEHLGNRDLQMKTLEIHFLSETFLGDTVLLGLEKGRNGGSAPVLYRGVKESDSAPVFQAKAEWFG